MSLAKVIDEYNELVQGTSKPSYDMNDVKKKSVINFSLEAVKAMSSKLKVGLVHISKLFL